MALRDLFLKPRPFDPATVAQPAGSAGAPRPPSAATADADPNPYLNARRSWNDYTGGIAHSRRLWQMMAFTASLTSLGAVGGLIYVASTAKFVPYVVRISDVGQPVAVGPAMPAAPIDPRVVEAEVASFITDARTVTSDYDLEKKGIFRIYSMLHRGDLAQRKINEWFSANADASPFAKAQKETVNVQISSVIAQSEHSWQVDWIETTFLKSAAPPTTDDTPPSPDGSTIASSPQMSAGGVSEHWRALVTLDYRPHNKGVSDKEIRANPMGIYVTDLSWSKVQ
ncbi:MAG: VirB8/TrbF family protein [Caulobacteraceae bacterium]